jgi:hypothetical protein
MKLDLKLDGDELIKLGLSTGLSVALSLYLSTPEDTITEVAKTACTLLGGTYLARGVYSAMNSAREAIVGQDAAPAARLHRL